LIATPAYRQQLAASVVQAVQNYRRAVGTQIGEVAARQEGPRVETNTPMLRATPSKNDPQTPTVIVPTAPAN
jgi:hypothetical protein